MKCRVVKAIGSSGHYKCSINDEAGNRAKGEYNNFLFYFIIFVKRYIFTLPFLHAAQVNLHF